MSTDPQLTQRSPRRFILAFVGTATLMLLPTILASLFLGPVEGDLARIGHLAEHDFGPRLPQAPLELIPQPGLGQPADVVLLGDSFSKQNAWQSELTRLTRRSVATWDFDEVGCTTDWIDKAIAGELMDGARVAIVASVEREFFERFSDPPGCPRASYPPHEPGPAGRSKRAWEVFPLDVRHVAESVGRYPESHRATGRYISNRVVTVDLVRRDLFSSMRPDRLLYYMDDELKFASWSDDETNALLDRLSVRKQQAATAGVTLLFLVIPDKSSVYWPHIAADQRLPYPEHGERLFTLIGERMGPQYNLLPYLRQQAIVQPDLYRPDDTHFSPGGYRLLASRVATWLQARR